LNWKAFIIGLSLAGAVAVADTKPSIVGTIANEAGGQIVLASSTTKGCSKRDLMFAYTRSPGGKIGATGCWRLDGESVFVFWDDGDVYEYDGLGIRFTDAWIKWMESQRGVQS
jgi:hypothetical protein